MVSTPLDIPVLRAPRERPLYSAAAMVAALVVFVGFAPSYYLKSAFGTPELSTLKHVHGLVMTAWFTLFFVQVWLVSAGRVLDHRRLGLFGTALAVLLIIVGMRLGIESVRGGFAPPGMSPFVFLIMPVAEVFVFGLLFGAAIVMRKRAACHKRLMLLASISMLAPAFARLPFTLTHGFPPGFFALTDLVILGCIAFDVARNRKVHPAFVGGLAVIMAGQVGRMFLAQTPQWTAFAKWLVG